MEGGGIPCELMYKCTECLQTFHCSERKREDHQYGYYTCRSCHQYVEPEHLYYTRAHTPSSPVQRQYILADIEASQKDERLQYEFVPVYYQGQWIPKRDLGLVIKQELFVSSPIARPPPNGYHSRLNYSKKSTAWLEWICHSARIEGKHLEIRHALTARGEYHYFFFNLHYTV